MKNRVVHIRISWVDYKNDNAWVYILRENHNRTNCYVMPMMGYKMCAIEDFITEHNPVVNCLPKSFPAAVYFFTWED